ncbi:hypothetical protein EBZ39_03680 [bacterium]|nr:hypothetical protein [bacterium]
MGVKLSIQIDGLAELGKQLEALPAKVAKKILRPAIRKAAKPVAAECKATAPVGPTGNLKRSFKVRAMKLRGRRRKNGVGVVITSPGSGRAPHAHLVEKGTQLRRKKSGAATGIMPANPFMQRAAEKTFPTVVGIFKNELSSRIAEVMRGS